MKHFIMILFIFIFAAIGVMWFIIQYQKEKRSLWLGMSFIIALIGLVTLIIILLIQLLDIWVIKMILFAGAFLVGVIFILFPVALIITMLTSGVQLIRREGLTFSHTLSFGFGIAYILYLVIKPVFQGILKCGFLDFLYTYLSFCFVFTLLIFVLYTVTNMLNLLKNPVKKYQYIIVLGSGLKDGYEVTPLLANRVDKGIEAYRQNEGSVLVFSGGSGDDEKIAEAEAMKKYALEQGIPESAILIEDKSSNTRENLLFSKRLIENHEKNIDNLLIVTTKFHVLRTLLLAKKLGIPCDGRGSQTKIYFSINAFIREWIAYLVLWRKKYISILVSSFIVIALGYFIIGLCQV
ncbi:MAG: YdcF family protein [Lachnospiraceae bacterium]